MLAPVLLPALLALHPARAAESKAQQIARLEAEIATLDQQAQARDATLAAMQDQLDSVLGETATLRERLAEEAASRQALADEMKAYEAQIAELREALRTGSKKSRPEQRLALLESQLEQMSARLTTLEASQPARPLGAPNSADEDAASALYRKANEAFEQGDIAAARSALAELKERYPGTRSVSSANRLQEQLEVIGSRPGEPVVLEWYTKADSVQSAPLALVVFWESWCPHCRREVPKLQAWQDSYGGRGLHVFGLTRLTRSATADTARAFVADNSLRFAVGQEDGDYAQAFAVSGIPAAALLVHGEVVWRGHPAKITAELLERHLPSK